MMKKELKFFGIVAVLLALYVISMVSFISYIGAVK